MEALPYDQLKKRRNCIIKHVVLFSNILDMEVGKLEKIASRKYLNRFIREKYYN